MAESFHHQLTVAIDARIKAINPGDQPVVEIQGALRHLTALYERIRSLVDYQDERFIRRLAIRRILIRRLLILNEAGPVGDGLVLELIRAGYIENGRIPQTMGHDLDERLTKYRTALPELRRHYQPPELLRLERQLLGVAAAELEDCLDPAEIELVLTDELALECASYLETEVDDALWLVALRAWLKVDTELAAWRMISRRETALWRQFVNEPTTQLSELIRRIARIDHDLHDRSLDARVRQFARVVPPYLVLADLAYHAPEETRELMAEPTKLRTFVETMIKRRIAASETKIQRSMVRATIYIFISKVIFGLPVEVAYDNAVHGAVNYFPLVVNTLVPPSLMLTAALSLRPPSVDNTRVLADRTTTLIRGEERTPLEHSVHHARTRRQSAGVFMLLMVLTYLIVFGGVIWLLKALSFNLVSSLIFFFFVSIVGFFAFRLRAQARELAVLEEPEGAFLAIFDFVALPFLRLGRALSITARSLNVVLFFLDFIVEAPLKLVFVVLEDWFAFLREKREELR